jgi:hypothetical protein
MLPRTPRHPPHHSHHSTSRTPTASQTATARPAHTSTALRTWVEVPCGGTFPLLKAAGEAAGGVPRAPVPGQVGKERA